MAGNSRQASQVDSFVRSLIEIKLDMDKVSAGDVRAVSNAYNAVLAAARQWAKDNQSARQLPEVKTGTSRTKAIDFTGDNAGKLADALQLVLNDALGERDWKLFNPALSVNRREQKYHTYRANVSKAFLKKFDNRFKEAGAETKPLGDDGTVEIAIPEGASWSGAGKNHNRRVDAWDSFKKAVNAEQKRAAAERAVEQRYLIDGGIDPDEFGQLPPKEQKTVLAVAGRTHRNKTLAAQKKVRHALVQSEIDKARALTGELDSIVFQDPLVPLPDADVRKLGPEASAYRRLYRRAEDSEQLLNNPEEIARIRKADLKKRGIQRLAEQEYYSDPANRDDPLYWEQIQRKQNIENREDTARYREAEQTPGTPEFKARIVRNLKSSEHRQEAIEEYISANPKSRLAKMRRQREEQFAAAKTRQRISGAARLTRNAVSTVINSILVAVSAAVGMLAKIQQGVMEVATTLRKQSLEAMTYNLDDSSMDRFKVFAKSIGMDPELLSQALGGVMGKWSDATLYQNGAINKLALILTDRTKDLFSMAAVDGMTDPNAFLNTLIMDVAEASAGGRGVYKDGIEADQAASMNYNALSMVDAAQAKLFLYYWEAFEKSGYALNLKGLREFVADKEKGGTFDEWWRNGGKNEQGLEKARELKTPAAEGASEELRARVTQTVAVLSTLKDSIFTRLAGKMDRIVAAIEGTLIGWFGKYMPTIAAEVKAKARNENAANLLRIQADLQMDEKKAAEELARTGFKGSLEEFRAAYGRFKTGDLLAFGRDTDMEKMGAFIANYGSIYDIRRARAYEIAEQQRRGPEKEGRVGAASANMIALESANQAMLFPLQLEKALDRTSVPDADPYWGKYPIVTSARRLVDYWKGFAKFNADDAQREIEAIDNRNKALFGFLRNLGTGLRIISPSSEDLAKDVVADYKEVFEFLSKQYTEHGKEVPAEITRIVLSPTAIGSAAQLAQALAAVEDVEYRQAGGFTNRMKRAQQSLVKYYAQRTLEFEDKEKAIRRAIAINDSPENNRELDWILAEQKRFHGMFTELDLVTNFVLSSNKAREDSLATTLYLSSKKGGARQFVQEGGLGEYEANTPAMNLAETEGRIANRQAAKEAKGALENFDTMDKKAAFTQMAFDAETRNLLKSEINNLVGGNINSMLEDGYRLLVDIDENDTSTDRTVELKLYLNDKLVKTASLNNKYKVHEDIWINDMKDWHAWYNGPGDQE